MQDHLEQDAPESEAWAIKFLTVSHRNALLHAVDPDYSGFVSVNEANQFTDAKHEEQRRVTCQLYLSIELMPPVQPPHLVRVQCCCLVV